MAAVPITISGVLCDKYGRTLQAVTLVGEATITGLGVGGGPIQPPAGGGEGPPHIWGPPDMPPGFWGGGMGPGVKPQPPTGGSPGVPTHPIYWPAPPHPEQPIYLPPQIWPNPPEGSAPLPEHPIVIPPPEGTDGPPLQVKVVWTPEHGWQVVLVPTGEHPAPSA